MRKIVLSIFAILLLSFTMSAQNLRISGTVTDENGEPVMYATVKVVGTSVTSYADLDGNFEIMAPANASLEFSSQTYETQTVRVNNRSTINVVLAPDPTMLTEFVVMGYGSARDLGSVSGTITTVGSEILGNKPAANVGDALSGQVPGMTVYSGSGEPAANVSMTIHGVGSLTAGTSPLVIVDGVPTSLNLNSFNSADIETITVLKDASATSIYGSRAANGVLVITTKKGKRNQDARITLSTQYGISSPVRSKSEFMNGRELLDFQLQFRELDQYSYDTLLEEYNTYGGTDWFDYMFDNKPYYNIDLSIAGGSSNTSYYISGGYMNKDGIAPRSYMERYSFRVNLDAQVKPWASMGTSMIVSNVKNSSTFASTSSTGGFYVYSPVWVAMVVPSYLRPYDEAGNMNVWLVDRQVPNPYALADIQPYSAESYRYNISTYININPIQGLNIKSLVGIDGYMSFAGERVIPNEVWNETFVARNAVRLYGITNTNSVEYKFNINKQHNFIALVAHEGILGKSNGFSAAKTGLQDDRATLLNNATDVQPENVGDSYDRYKYLSFFGQLAYNYMDKYYFDGSLRYDGSSRFGENNRFSLFYSAGLVWNVKKEDFMKNVRDISALRFRINYGTQGNSSIGNYMTQALMGTSSSSYAGETIFLLSSNPGNPNLKWETSRQFTVGVDIGLWNKVDVSASYFYKKSEDMLFSTPLAPSTGFTSQMQNIAEMHNQGIELDLSATLYQNKDWHIYASTNFTYQTSAIDKLYGDVTQIQDGYTLLRVGSPFGMFSIWENMGIDPRDGRYMWNDGNGNPVKNVALAKVMPFENKNIIPPYFGGFNLGATWRNISVSTQFAYAIGKYSVNMERYASTDLGQTGLSRLRDMIDNIWMNPGDVTDYPRYGQSNIIDSRFIENTSYLRMKDLTVSYSLPKSVIERTGFLTNVRVYFTARNLLTFTSYTGNDPEPYAQTAGAAYPNTREYIGGLEIVF